MPPYVPYSTAAPSYSIAEAEEHLSALVVQRGGDPERALAFLRALGDLVELIGSEVYGAFEPAALERLGNRDPDDWPILAAQPDFGLCAPFSGSGIAG